MDATHVSKTAPNTQREVQSTSGVKRKWARPKTDIPRRKVNAGTTVCENTSRLVSESTVKNSPITAKAAPTLGATGDRASVRCEPSTMCCPGDFSRKHSGASPLFSPVRLLFGTGPVGKSHRGYTAPLPGTLPWMGGFLECRKGPE